MRVARAMNVFRRESRLGLGGFGDRLLKIAAIGLAAIENAGLVEMDVGLDKAGRDQAAAEIDGLALGREIGLDGGNPPGS